MGTEGGIAPRVHLEYTQSTPRAQQEVWERREASVLTIKIRSLTLFKRAGRCGYCAPEARASHRFASA